MKKNFEEKFSPKTRSIINMAKNIFLDMPELEMIRQRSMFGFKSFLINGNTFCLIGEFIMKRKGETIDFGETGKPTPTIIILAISKDFEKELMSIKGSGYFAPSGTKLKSWVCLTGEWITSEESIAVILQRQVLDYKLLPFKPIKHQGYLV